MIFLDLLQIPICSLEFLLMQFIFLQAQPPHILYLFLHTLDPFLGKHEHPTQFVNNIDELHCQLT
jgi:hypothetical protein